MTSKRQPRRAVSGHCPCGAPTLRGLDGAGELAHVDRAYLDAAHELDAARQGRQTYALVWRGHLELDARTAADLLASPAGYRRDAPVVRAHRCGDSNA
jgi:hypothetical protein